MPSPPSPPSAPLQRLLAAARAVTGLRVIFRDLSGRSALPGAWMQHLDPACLRAKASPGGIATCVAFCAGSALRDLAADGTARIHTCPFGHVEIAVPVHARDRYLGVIFAGPCRIGGPPAQDLVTAPDRAWLEDRLLLLEGVAERIAALLGDAPPVGKDRQARIMAFIERGLARPLTLAALARHIGLSPSRCGHHVKELFGITFPALVRRTRMQAAARLLADGDLPVAVVAGRVGCRDRDWFARHFRLVHGCTPAAWRKRRDEGP